MSYDNVKCCDTRATEAVLVENMADLVKENEAMVNDIINMGLRIYGFLFGDMPPAEEKMAEARCMMESVRKTCGALNIACNMLAEICNRLGM